MKKRFLAMMMAVMMAVMTGLTGCGSSNEGNDGEATVTIGISQFAEHASLDNCREGFLQGLSEAGFVEGENLIVEYQNDCLQVGKNQLGVQFFFPPYAEAAK